MFYMVPRNNLALLLREYSDKSPNNSVIGLPLAEATRMDAKLVVSRHVSVGSLYIGCIQTEMSHVS